MKKIIIISISIIMLTLVVSFVLAMEEKADILITNIEGKVVKKVEKNILSIFTVQTYKRLDTNSILKPGDTVITGENGLLEYYYREKDIFIKIDSSTEVVIGKENSTGNENKLCLYLNKGRIWSKVKKVWQQMTNFEVITPSAIAGVRGTIFSVTVEDEKTILSVQEGTVLFLDSSRTQKKEVSSGYMSTAYNGKITAPEVMNHAEKAKWQQKDVLEWVKNEKKSSPKPDNKLDINSDKKKDNSEGKNNKDKKKNNNQGKGQKNKPPVPVEGNPNSKKDDGG